MAAEPAVEIEGAALARLEEDLGAEALRELVQAALTDDPSSCRELKQALAAGDAEHLRRAAHTLRSTSQLLGARALAELFGGIEDAALQGRLDAAAVARALGRHRRFTSELRSQLRRVAPPA